jgi:hypothetical protein
MLTGLLVTDVLWSLLWSPIIVHSAQPSLPNALLKSRINFGIGIPSLDDLSSRFRGIIAASGHMNRK